ncbi:MAG: hypothetical protein NXI20_07240 [bacterium]|nr:hypothetical protein [bacterium]
MKRNKMPEFLQVLYFLPFILVILFFFYRARSRSNNLISTGQKTVGITTRVYEIRSRGRYLVYEFKVGTKSITDHQSIDQDVELGKCYKVLFDPKDYTNCKIFLDEPMTCLNLD